MPFSRPTLGSLVTQIQQDYVSRLSLNGAVLRRSMVYVLARVFAGVAHLLHGRLNYLSQQIFADTAVAEYLVRIGSLFGVTPNPATFAVGSTVATGTNGTVINSGTVFVRSDGALFASTASATIASGTASIPVQASLAGAAGNSASGTTLTLQSPIAGMNSSTAVDSNGLTNGTDPEMGFDGSITAAFRARVVARMQSSPSGGNANDYVTWAKQVSGVTRAWVYPLALGAATVVVRFMRDNDAAPGIPSGAAVTAVQNYINGLAPVTATVTVLAPVAAPVNFSLHIVPSNTTTQAAVQAQLQNLLLAQATPGGTLLLSQIETAVGKAAGVTDFTITIPAANVTNSTGQISTLGTVTFT